MIKGNVERLTEKNKLYRSVISTDSKQQLVLMNLAPGVEIGEEVHPHTSQFIRVEKGRGRAVVDGKRYRLSTGDFLLIPPGAVHNVINSSGRSLKLYTIYSPPHHPIGLKERERT